MNSVLISTVFLLATACAAFAQHREIMIKGVLIDSILSVAVEGANIRLSAQNMERGNSKSLSGGVFHIKEEALAGESILVELFHLNYKTEVRSVEVADGHFIYDLGEIFLSPRENLIKEISVVGRARILGRKIDRITYDVRHDPDRNVESLYDIVQKVPLVTIDGIDKIAVKGNTNFRILVNGKESVLFAQDPARTMKTLRAGEIERIEVITNPPAKYDLEGVSSLINIVTKKQIENGYNIFLATLYNFPYGPMAHVNASFKANKFHSTFLGSIFNQRVSPLPFSGEAVYEDSSPVLRQTGSQRFKGNSVTLSGNITYEVDSLNLLTLGISNIENDFSRKIHTVSKRDGQNTAEDLSQDGLVDWKTTSLDLTYQKTFRKSPAQQLQLSYRYVGTYNIEDDFLIFENPGLADTNQVNRSGLDEHTVQVDYEQPFRGFSIESGGKYTNRKNNSTFSSTASERSSRFDYDYSVFNLYHSFQVEREKWSFKGGGRLDIASRLGESRQEADVKFLPSLNIQRSLTGKSAINASYNKKVTRPNISQLNPFEDRSNSYFLSTGNPMLKPVIGHSANLSYNYFDKISLYADIGYSYTGNSIERVLEQMSGERFLFTYLNIGKKRDFNSNVNLGYSYRKMRFTVNGAISYIDLNSDHNGARMANSGWKSNASFIFSIQAPHKIRAGLNIRYNTPDITLQGKTHHYLNSSFSLSKEMFDDRFRVFASINNPFTKFYDKIGHYHTPFARSFSRSRMYHRSFVITLSYNLSNGSTKRRDPKKSIENDDHENPGPNIFR